MRHARVIVVFAFGVLGAAAALQACGGSSDASSFSGQSDPSGNPSGQPGTPGDDVVQPPIDSGPDGETINDGGSNYPEGGEDAGECPIPLDLVQEGTEAPSECISFVPPQLQGGALVQGKYILKATHALAPRAFCEGPFQPVPIAGTLTLALAQADAGTRWMFEVVFSSGGNERRTRAILTPAAGNTSPLQADPVCPDRPPGNVRYGSQLVTVGDGSTAQRLAMLLPYGNGGAVYVFEKAP